MRALLVSFEFGEHVLGGLSRVINGVTTELRHHADVDVYLLYFNPKRLAISAKLYRCNREQDGELSRSFTRGYARNLVELLKTEKYDLVHFFSVHWIIGNIVNSIRKELPDQRLVYSIHSLIKYEHGTRLNPQTFLSCEQKLIESATVVHVLNRATQLYFERSYPQLACEKPLRIIPNGVEARDFSARDPDFSKRLRSRLGADRRTIVCLSRWTHGKGLEFYVEAAEKLLETGHDLQFVLAGRKYISWEKRWYTYLARIQRMAGRLGGRFVVLGWLSSAQRNTLFDMADLAVMPSELEYYPYSVLEPAAAGLPLVCSDLPCVRELLEETKECLFFRSGDSQDLANKIAESCRAPEQALERAARARRKVFGQCDWRSIASDYARMYRDAVALSPPRPRAGAA